MAEACEKITDGTHHSPPNRPRGAFKYITAKNIRPSGLDLTDISYVDADVHAEIFSRCPVEKGDVLYIKDGVTTGVAINNPLEEPFSMLSSVALLKPDRRLLDESFLRYWLNSPETVASLVGRMTGSAIRRLTLTSISNQAIPLPPIAEQRLIVKKLKTLNAYLSSGRAELERIPLLARRYKEVLLDAAVTGRLTMEWRRLNGVGSHWPRAALGSLAQDVRYGTAVKCSYAPEKTPVLRIPNISSGRIDTNDLKHAAFDRNEIEKLALRAGDLLVIRSNGSVSLVGRTAVATSAVEGYLFAGYLIRIRLDQEQVRPTYINLAFAASSTRSMIESLARSTSGVNNINSEQLKSLIFAVPGLAEQDEIARVLEEAFEEVDKVVIEAQSAVRQIAHLNRSILSRAFRGELVRQNASNGAVNVRFQKDAGPPGDSSA